MGLSNSKGVEKLNSWETSFLLQKNQLGAYMLSYPIFFSRAGIIGGLTGCVIGYLIALYGNLTCLAVTVENEKENEPLVIKTLQEVMYLSVHKKIKSFMYYLIICFLIAQVLCFALVE